MIYLVTVEKAEKQNQVMLRLKSKYSEEKRHYICLNDTLIILGTCTVSCGGCVQFACTVCMLWRMCTAYIRRIHTFSPSGGTLSLFIALLRLPPSKSEVTTCYKWIWWNMHTMAFYCSPQITDRHWPLTQTQKLNKTCTWYVY